MHRHHCRASPGRHGHPGIEMDSQLTLLLARNTCQFLPFRIFTYHKCIVHIEQHILIICSRLFNRPHPYIWICRTRRNLQVVHTRSKMVVEVLPTSFTTVQSSVNQPDTTNVFYSKLSPTDYVVFPR